MPDQEEGEAPAQVNILIYEDDEACGFALSTILLHAGYRVVVANHFAPALDALDNQPPIDLLIADIVMPAGGVNGAALARMARMRNPTTRVVYVTGFDVPLLNVALEGPLLRKPVSHDQLLATVTACLGSGAT